MLVLFACSTSLVHGSDNRRIEAYLSASCLDKPCILRFSAIYWLFQCCECRSRSSVEFNDPCFHAHVLPMYVSNEYRSAFAGSG